MRTLEDINAELEQVRQKLDRALALRNNLSALEKAVAHLRSIEQHNSDMMKKLLDDADASK